VREFKDVPDLAPTAGPEDLRSEHLELLLQEAERALLGVEDRIDEPGRRSPNGVGPEEEISDDAILSLRLAMAELVDAHPALAADIDQVSERMRTLGASAGAATFALHHHLVDLTRLSLEAMFLQFATAADYAALEESEDPEGELDPPGERYAAYRGLLDMLRRSLN
jgi:hypothetical protein